MKNKWPLVLLLCLTLGLAPYFPEPHLWGKLKWIAGGGVNMTAKDWFDTVLHGLPFLLAIGLFIANFSRKSKK